LAAITHLADRRATTVGPSTPRSRIWIITAAGVPAAFYAFFVYHFSVNVPIIDDWQVMPLVASAIHGHLEMGALWKQWSDGREVMGRLVIIAFGLIDHLNERAVMLFGAAVFIATYVLVLLLFKSYLARRLTPLPVFVLGIVWFSLVDWSSALWAFQVSGYLCLFFLILTLYLLLVRQDHARLLFGLGVATAVMASLSFVQGFVAWPLGLICLVWASKRNKTELAIWVIAGAVTTAVYLNGYSSTNVVCVRNCALTYGPSHLGKLIQYFVLLVGDIIPSSTTGIESHLWVHGIQGAALLIVALLVVMQTLREGRVQPNPLPLLLMVLALLTDLITAVGRVREGLQGAVAPLNSRYTMPNVILLVAIVIFAWAHAPKLHIAAGLRLVGFGTLMALLLIQCVIGTEQGISQGRAWHQLWTTDARILLTIDLVPRSQRGCYLANSVVLDPQRAALWYGPAKRNHLSVFQPDTERMYRAQGPLYLVACDQLKDSGP
jgi:hypothetical protein